MSRQTEIATGVCSHRTTEEIINYAEQAIALRCAVCTMIMCHIGNCDGCRKLRKLTKFTMGHRYCGEECWRQVQALKRKAKQAEMFPPVAARKP